MNAVIGTNGWEPVVWGVGGDAEEAYRDAVAQDCGTLLVDGFGRALAAEITEEQLHALRGGEVSCSALGIHIIGTSNGYRVVNRSIATEIRINVYRAGGRWFGARWIGCEYDGCDALECPDDATDAQAVAYAAGMPLAVEGSRVVHRVDDVGVSS